MEQNYVDFKYFILFILFLSIAKVHLQDSSEKSHNGINNERACAYVQCENNDTCVHRKFRCKDPPCPSMLYCAKSRTELLKGPSICDTVRCSSGYLCILKVRRCQWDEKCRQQIARCVSRKVYHEGPASCAGFKCAQGSQCILRESFCKIPPCKLLRSCAKNKDIHIWFSKCRSLGCPSQFECFLRRPEHTCPDPPCKHTPDCTTTEDEALNEHCRGWICPRTETCDAEIIGSCETDDCNVKRTCRKDYTVQTNYTSSFSRRSVSNKAELLNETVSTETDAKNTHFRNASQQSVNEKANITNEVISVNETCLFGCRMANRVSQLLNRSNSNTELNTIHFWLKNGEEQRNFKDKFSQKNWHTARRGIDPFPRERNFTNTIDEDLTTDKILLSPYTALETILLNSLKESDHLPALDVNLKYPFHKADQILPSQLINIKNAYEYPNHLPLAENIGEPENFQSINRNPSFYHSLEDQYEMLPQSKISDVQEDAFFSTVSKISEILKNSTLTEDGLSSLWTESDENLEKGPFHQEKYFIEDSDSISENETVFDKTQKYTVDINLIEQLIKALLPASTENTREYVNKNEGNRRNVKDSRTSGLIYRDEEPTLRSFYNLPSYGTDDNVNVGVGVYEYKANGKSQAEENHSEYRDMNDKFTF